MKKIYVAALEIFLSLQVLALSCMLFCGCADKKEECTIYGTVILYDDGTPVAGCDINVENKQHAVTGSDGYYEVSFVPLWDYSKVNVTVSNSYYGYYKKNTVEVHYGERVKCDFLIW